MQRDHCGKVAIIYDGGDYSQGMSVLMSLIAGPQRIFSEDVRPNERPERYRRLAQSAKHRGADCFVYMGADNPNTFGIFEAFANALGEDAWLYGTDGVNQSSLKDDNGGLGTFASRVRLMAPPRDLGRYRAFEARFENAYNDAVPDPYVVYGFEAMRLALDAIRESGSGARADILEQLKSTTERDSRLGTYSIDSSSGDTTLTDYDYLTFEGGRSNPRRAVPRDELKKSVAALRQRKK